MTETLADGGAESVHYGSHPSAGCDGYASMQPMVCCPHHSCMMSPISPVTRSCQMLHPFPSGSPVIYTSPLVYNPPPRRSGRLQRWNSVDGNIGAAHVWSNDPWSRPSLDDSYGSEAGLCSRMERPLRPAYSCQPHGMFSPFCRSFEYNIWGQRHNSSQDLMESSAAAASTSHTHSNSNLSLNVNLNETPPPPDTIQPMK